MTMTRAASGTPPSEASSSCAAATDAARCSMYRSLIATGAEAGKAPGRPSPAPAASSRGRPPTTRAVRKRLDFTRPVEPKVLLDCIRIATQAPSGGNAQRWRWIVVTDPERKAIVAHYYALAFYDYIAPKLDMIEPGDHASVRMT